MMKECIHSASVDVVDVFGDDVKIEIIDRLTELGKINFGDAKIQWIRWMIFRKACWLKLVPVKSYHTWISDLALIHAVMP